MTTIDGHYYCLEKLFVTETVKTPLIKAVRQGDVAKTAELLALDLDLLGTDNDGNTALHHAAQGKSIDCLKLLCDAHKARGESVDILNFESETPLQIAALNRDPSGVKELLMAGAELECSLMETVIWEKLTDILQVMITSLVDSGQSVDLQNKQGRSLLMYAAKLNRLNEATLLLNASASCTLADSSGNTALHHAADRASPEMADLLIRHGASLTALDMHGQTPHLHAKTENNARFYRHIKGRDTKADAYSKECYRRIRLAHICKISGTTTLPHPARAELLTVELEGWYAADFWKIIHKRLQCFFSQCSELPAGINPEEVVDLCSFTVQTRSRKASLLERYKQSKPICLNTGYEEHHSTFLLWNNLFIICDKSKIESQTLPLAVEIEQEKVTKEFLSEILHLPDSPIDDYVHFLLYVLPLYRPKEPQIALTERLAHLLKLPRLETATCTWDNTEAAIFALFILQMTRYNDTLVPEARKADKELQSAALAFFKEWQTFVATYEQQKYLTRIKSLDTSMIDNDFLQKVLQFHA